VTDPTDRTDRTDRTEPLDGTSDPPEASAPSNPSRKVRSLGELARRCRRRTTDLLAIGLLLVVGLAVGRQLAAWWNEAELQSTPNPLSVTGSGAAWTDPDELQLGELGQTIHRRRVSGDRQAAWSALEASTRVTAQQAGWPAAEADEAERQLLELLDRRESRRSQSTSPQQPDTSLYRLEGPLPMVVAVRRLLGQRRVVGWGLATRTPAEGWVTWTFATAGHADTLPVELPEGSRKLLAVGSGNPEQLLVFSGSAGPDDWWKHFERALRRDGWTLSSPAAHNADGWTARWQHRSGQALVVSARHHNSGQWHGMLNVFTPIPAGTSAETSGSSPKRQVQREST
jgi:hypothetical protein